MHATYYTSGVVRDYDSVTVYMRVVITSTGLTLSSRVDVWLQRLRGVATPDVCCGLPGAYRASGADRDELYTYDEEG